ncbi:hypothetical protein MNBD_ALPHA11-1133 [hydrothermal vent metagenome]|uniref:Uncharacterized protein n=1 Tax=hydrothermal vent metagenome TaxID=652676 RepID=A0A3B0U6R1_9ZZZZ
MSYDRILAPFKNLLTMLKLIILKEAVCWASWWHLPKI